MILDPFYQPREQVDQRSLNQYIQLQPIKCLVLYRQKGAQPSFQQQLLVYICRRRLLNGSFPNMPTFAVREVPDQKMNNLFLPVLLVNNKHTIEHQSQPGRFEKVCLNLYHNISVNVYFDRLAALEQCRALTQHLLVRDNQSRGSKHWLLVSPFQRLHDYFVYKKTKSSLEQEYNLRKQEHQQKHFDFSALRVHLPIKQANLHSFKIYLAKLQPYTTHSDSFVRDCLYVCFHYILARKTDYSEMVNCCLSVTRFLRAYAKGELVQDRKRTPSVAEEVRSLARQVGLLYPVLKCKPQQITPPTRLQRPANVGIAWALAFAAAIWLPSLYF